MSAPKTKSYGFLPEYVAQRKAEYRTLYKRWRTGSNPYDWPPWHWTDECVYVALPHELLLMICGYLYQADLLHLALACRMLADITIPLLYTRDITQFDSLSLRWGCTFGIIETLERAFGYGASVDHQFACDSALNCGWVDREYRYSYLCNTPLKIAIRWNEVGVVRFLLRKGAQVNEQGGFSIRGQRYYPLHFAVSIPGVTFGCSFEPGSPQIVRCILEAGADPNQLAASDTTTPLSLAMSNAVPIETVRLLLEAGAHCFRYIISPPNHDWTVYGFGWLFHRVTPPFYPLDEDKIGLLIAYTEPTKLLCVFSKWLERLSDAYSYFMCQQFAKVTILFIQKGVDLVSCVESGISPIVSLIHAARKWADNLWARRPVKLDKLTFVMKLLHDVITNMCEATIVGTCVESHGVKRSAIIDAVNSNPETSNGKNAGRDISALQLVCMPFGFPGRVTLIPLLLWYGADLKKTDSAGAGVLHHASTFGPEDRARPLLEFLGGLWSSRLDINARDDYGWTPLHYACVFSTRTKLHDQVRTARLLLDHGADVHARTHDGWTCLEFAFRCGNDDMVSLLLDRGAQPEDQTRPPGWEESEASHGLISFCECVESFPPYMVTRLVAHYRRASSTTYAGYPLKEQIPDGRRLQTHMEWCWQEASDAPFYPFGVFHGVSH
ncbi:hypothetical protein QBC44DRAFT_111754 [Cladorrhinum sp. PSN332]|nr:hypothetical protein QBC44DRAFT_111754 [Cladorrhinum sp. PSN332]